MPRPSTWSRGHGEIVSLLLSSGVDVDAERTDGETALLQASRNGHGEVASLLLSSGADVNVQSNDGMTTLLAATVNRHAEVFSLLLSYWEAAREAANAQAEDNTPLAEDDPRLVVVREWSGAVRTYMQCEPGESVFYGETFVPCGSTFKNYRNQLVEEWYSHERDVVQKTRASHWPISPPTLELFPSPDSPRL